MARLTSPRLWPTTRALSVGLVVASLLSWSHPPGTAPLRLSVGTGGAGGVYHVYGTGLAQVTEHSPDIEITALTTAASVQNNRLIASGSLDAAFTLADVAALAVAGEEPFDDPLPITAIARLYDNHTHLVVRADSPYERVADLAGGTVSVGDRGSGTEMMAERLLAAAGLAEGPERSVPGPAPAGGTPDTDDPSSPGVERLRLSIGNSTAALAEGRIDAFFWSGGLPTEAVSDLAEQVRVRLLDLSEHVPQLVEEHGQFFSELPVPAGTYPGVPAVRTIGVPSLLVADERMPDRTATRLTRLLFNSQGAMVEIHPVALHLHPRSAISTLPVPLHPGASVYYRSVKYAHDESAVGPGPVRPVP